MGKIKVVVKNPSESAKVIEISNNIEELQKIVDGYIEKIDVRGLSSLGIMTIANEEGILLNMPPNIIVDNNIPLVGPIIFCGEDFTSIPEDAIDDVLLYCSRNDCNQ